jgi:hypothetical protein
MKASIHAKPHFAYAPLPGIFQERTNHRYIVDIASDVFTQLSQRNFKDK